MEIRRKQTVKRVECPKGAFESYRFTTAKDGFGYTLTHTDIKKGGPYFWHYKKHVQESCYCVSGKGSIKCLNTGEVFQILPGTMYTVGPGDPHELTAETDMVLVCVFNPPLRGGEVHGEDGSYG